MIDVLYDTWISLTEREGMTNYVHILVSDHVTYYIRKKRNLYRYSNQSWECLNKRVKIYYSAKPQMAGSHGNYAGDVITNLLTCSHIVSLAR